MVPHVKIQLNLVTVNHIYITGNCKELKIASEMPIPHSLGKVFNTMTYRSNETVQ